MNADHIAAAAETVEDFERQFGPDATDEHLGTFITALANARANRLQKLAVLRADFLASRQQELEQYIERRREEEAAAAALISPKAE